MKCTPDHREIAENREDYLAFMRELHFTEEEIQAVVLNQHDCCAMPEGFAAVRLGESLLHGVGMFAACNVEAWQVIAQASMNGMRTPAGRFTNHAMHPNCIAVMMPGGDCYMVAVRDVAEGEELTVNYRQVGHANGNTARRLAHIAASGGDVNRGGDAHAA